LEAPITARGLHIVQNPVGYIGWTDQQGHITSYDRSVGYSDPEVVNTRDEVHEVRFGRTGRTHVPIFVYVIDDLERFGRSIGNTGKRNGVMVF
jgi:hypothetical protein